MTYKESTIGLNIESKQGLGFGSITCVMDATDCLSQKFTEINLEIYNIKTLRAKPKECC